MPQKSSDSAKYPPPADLVPIQLALGGPRRQWLFPLARGIKFNLRMRSLGKPSREKICSYLDFVQRGVGGVQPVSKFF